MLQRTNALQQKMRVTAVQMPKRRRAWGRGRPKKRKYKRTRRGRRRRRRVRYTMPSKMLVKLRYNTKVTLDPDATALGGEHLFRANCIYDPDYTGAGHQPRGFDQWMGLYHRFHVIGSRIRARCVSIGTETVPFYLGISKSRGGSSNLGIAEENIERIGTSTMVLPGGNNIGRVKSSFSTKRFYKIKNMMDNDQLSGTASSSPTWVSYYHLYIQPVDTAKNLNAQIVDVTLDFVAVLSEPSDIAAS